MNVPLEPTQLEPERDRARGREKQARGLVAFEARWPTAAADDRQRTSYAWAELADEDREKALAGIAPFLEYLKRVKRSAVPAGWRYLEERRWELIEAAAPPARDHSAFARESPEGRAVLAVHEVARVRPFECSAGIIYRHAMTPQLLAFAEVPPRQEWPFIEDRQQVGAWSEFIADAVTIARPTFVQERAGRRGIFAPWPWPPRKDGSLCTGPPDATLTADDEANLDKL